MRMVRFINPSQYRGKLFSVGTPVNRKAEDVIMCLVFQFFLDNRRLLYPVRRDLWDWILRIYVEKVG